jgi:flagellar basal-body rod protein FlgF
MRAREGIELQPASGDTLIPGALEGSNVNIADSMVNMIDLARRFELQTQMMKNADENAQQAATIMRMG